MRTIFHLTSRFSPYFRRRRHQAFLRIMRPEPRMRILDVGGLPQFWCELPVAAHVVLLNCDPVEPYQEAMLHSRLEYVVGDGTALPYEDQSFDLVFSNSVIEHVGDFNRQEAFAREARRVGRGYWIQTPAREFPFEPHYFGPFVHWLPPKRQPVWIRYATAWGWLERPGPEAIQACMRKIRLLSRKEMLRLFPGCRLHVERVLGMPKSYTACRLPNAPVRVADEISAVVEREI